MNIGQLMRGLLGEAKASDGKALELKVGQIVRGLIVQMMDNQEAIVQINGTQIRAKLETLLQAGQSTLLQVQPQLANGQLVLKTVDQQAAAMPQERLMEWLKALGLPDQKWAGDLVRELRRDGMTLTRELSSQFQQASAAKPAGADAQSYMQAAAIAVKRGLPMTEATIVALRQALAGPPAHVLLDTLEQGLTAWRGSADGGGAPAAAQALVSRTLTLLAEGAAFMRSAAAQSEALQTGSLNQNAPQTGGTGAGQGLAASQSAAVISSRAGTAGGAAAAAQAAVAALGAAAELASDNPAAANQGSRTAAAAEPARSSAALPASSGGGTQAAAPVSELLQGTSAAASLSGASTNWINGLMKWLGVDHERMLAQSVLISGSQGEQPGDPDSGRTQAAEGRILAQHAAGGTAGTASHAERGAGHVQQQGERALTPAAVTPPLPQAAAEGGGSLPDSAPKGAAETLKSALLSLVSSDSLPSSLKDTAQQLVQQITGQQLLLSQERTSSMFTHVTMFIPLKDQDGAQTASVHIQTRRGSKGELDPDNCRLLFDLNMKTLGSTVVDVQVVDKIVSLNLWNDHPAMPELMDASREEMTEALRQAGYQLLTLRTTPLPDRTDAGLPTAQTFGPGAIPAEWSAKPYKGVDFRV
ncbi:hypothetical protein [Paenibacillus spongiae]|uniref:Flagellar hook-length control protein FliK n=1 Tax=Paenibacillus spongiae TaxID=2909671 RepID=A0ABY5SFC4_9BACL|nr:hypothetical protein [Paenibacillus spongiae]UVI32479.1 hypothetical protein L1F29_11920 [Paenibacillus spongiae]